MKKLSDYIKNDYSDKDIINVFFREKFGDVTDRIYTHDAALLPSIFQQAEAAGMALTSKSPTRQGEQYHYRNSNLELVIITYVYNASPKYYSAQIFLYFILLTNEICHDNQYWEISYREDMKGYFSHVTDSLPSWLQECKELIHQANIIRKQLNFGKTAVKVFLDDMLRRRKWQHTLEQEKSAWLLDIKLPYHRSLNFRIPFDIDIGRLANLEEQIAVIEEASRKIGSVATGIKNYGTKSDWKIIE